MSLPHLSWHVSTRTSRAATGGCSVWPDRRVFIIPSKDEASANIMAQVIGKYRVGENIAANRKFGGAGGESMEWCDLKCIYAHFARVDAVDVLAHATRSTRSGAI